MLTDLSSPYLRALEVKEIVEQNPHFKWANGAHTLALSALSGLLGGYASFRPCYSTDDELSSSYTCLLYAPISFIAFSFIALCLACEQDLQTNKKMHAIKAILKKYRPYEVISQSDMTHLIQLTSTAAQKIFKGYKVCPDSQATQINEREHQSIQKLIQAIQQDPLNCESAYEECQTQVPAKWITYRLKQKSTQTMPCVGLC